MDHAGKHPRVLIVDDEPSICLTLAYRLGDAGYDVATANSLTSARDALDLVYFPVVITDLCLSGKGSLEGLEVLRHARRRSPGTGVIVMSANVSEELREKVHLLGASRCIEKPYVIDELLDSVRGIAGEVVQ